MGSVEFISLIYKLNNLIRREAFKTLQRVKTDWVFILPPPPPPFFDAVTGDDSHRAQVFSSLRVSHPRNLRKCARTSAFAPPPLGLEVWLVNPFTQLMQFCATHARVFYFDIIEVARYN